MGESSIQIGWIPYWNLLPLQHEVCRLSGGLFSGAASSDFKVLMGHPSTVNRWLNDGTVQVAPASSITLLKTKSLDLALPLGIASDGAVQSVYLGLHRHHEDFCDFVDRRQRVLRTRFLEAEALFGGDQRQKSSFIWSASRTECQGAKIPRLHLTPASDTSAALTQLVMHLWLGQSQASAVLSQAQTGKRELTSRMLDDAPVELVIGDEALQRRHEFWRVLDLGQIWRDLTGLPFVFGLWQTSSRTLSPSLRRMIAEAATIAQMRMRVEPQAYFPENPVYAGDGRPVDLAAYWKVIEYSLGERHMQSLLLYFSLYLEMCDRDIQGSAFDRFMRWSQLWGHPAV